jgi:hypothetical protein
MQGAESDMPDLARLDMPALRRHVRQFDSSAVGNLVQGIAIVAGAAGLCAVSLLAYRSGALRRVATFNIHR